MVSCVVEEQIGLESVIGLDIMHISARYTMHISVSSVRRKVDQKYVMPIGAAKRLEARCDSDYQIPGVFQCSPLKKMKYLKVFCQNAVTQLVTGLRFMLAVVT